MTSWLGFAAIAGACCLLSSHASHAAETAAADGGWGTVEGRIVFAGDMNAAALKPYRESIKVREPRSIQDSIRGVEGRVVATAPNESLLIDPKTRGLGNAFVYLKTKPARVHPSSDQPLETVECVLRGQLFSPRAMVVEVGQTVRMLSKEEGVTTNFQGSNFRKNEGFHRLVSSSVPSNWKPSSAESLPTRVTSNIHPAAVSYWLVVDHPYAAITKPDGSFQLKNLPEGEHELTVWHEAVGYVAKKLAVTVVADKVEILAPVELTIDRLK